MGYFVVGLVALLVGVGVGWVANVFVAELED